MVIEISNFIKMKNKNKIIAPLLSIVFVLPSVAFAAVPKFLFENVCSGVDCDFAALVRLANNIVDWFVGMSIVIATVTFTIAGANMLMHPEEPAKRQEAIKMFQKTFIGLLIVLGAWLIVHVIVTALVSNSSSALRFLNK